VTETTHGGVTALTATHGAAFRTRLGGVRFVQRGVRAQLFVPAARTTVLALDAELEECRRENPDVLAVEEFLERTGCEVVVEAANHPLTEAAETYLEQHGVTIVPDVLVNIGGMVGCYAEWRYRPLLRRGAVSLAELADQCHALTAHAVEGNLRLLASRTTSARAATRAIVVANRKAMRASDTSGDLFGLDRLAYFNVEGEPFENERGSPGSTRAPVRDLWGRRSAGRGCQRHPTQAGRGSTRSGRRSRCRQRP
jgi:hypothetical protein